MFGTYFYHQLTRKYIILFGNLFNNITIKRVDKDDNTEIERLKVPIVYGSKEKYFVRLKEDSDLNLPTQVLLPRMSFELLGINYDETRKQNSLLPVARANTASRASMQYMGVPYDLEFELEIYTRSVDDGTHIVEQILPSFNPDYTLTINAVPEVGLTKDIPIILKSVSHSVEHDGNYDAVRYVTWTLTFTMKAYYFGPVSTPKIIRKIFANIFNDPALQSGYIVRLNTGNVANNSTFKLDDVAFAGNNYTTATAYGVVLGWNPGTGRLVLGGTQGQFRVGNTIRALSTNVSCNIASFALEPLKLVEIKIEPDPLDAEPTDDYGYTTTITEWPETE
jgi:hypothetical protein